MQFDVELLDRLVAELEKHPKGKVPVSLRRARNNFVDELHRCPKLASWIKQKANADCSRTEKDTAGYNELRQLTSNDVSVISIRKAVGSAKPSLDFRWLQNLCDDDDALDCVVTAVGGSLIDAVLRALGKFGKFVEQTEVVGFAAETASGSQAGEKADSADKSKCPREEWPNDTDTTTTLVTIKEVAELLAHLQPSSMTNYIKEWGDPVIQQSGTRPAQFDLAKIRPTLKRQFSHASEADWSKLEASATPT